MMDSVDSFPVFSNYVTDDVITQVTDGHFYLGSVVARKNYILIEINIIFSISKSYV